MAVLKEVSDLEEGMLLATPVTNNYGQVLLAEGIEISTKHLKMLKMWNIPSVYIQSDEAEEELEVDDETMERARKFLFSRMNWKPRNKNEEDLVNLGLISIATQLQKKG